MRPDSPTPQDHGLGVGGSVVGVAGGAGSDIGGSIAAGQFAGSRRMALRQRRARLERCTSTILPSRPAAKRSPGRRFACV